MTELPADVEAIKLQLLDGVRREMGRRRRRRRAIRTALIAVGATATLSVSALAAGNIDLGEGVQALHVAGYPAYNVQTKQIVLAGTGRYVYHITGGKSRTCPGHSNDIYVTSRQALDPEELKAAAETANGIQPKTAMARIKGLLSLSNGCGDAGVEATTDVPHPSPSALPAPVTLYGVNGRDARDVGAPKRSRHAMTVARPPGVIQRAAGQRPHLPTRDFSRIRTRRRRSLHPTDQR